MSVYDISGDAINTFYDSGGLTVTDLYDANGNLIAYEDITFADSATVTNVHTWAYSGGPAVPEGGCMDDDGNAYVCYYQGAFLRYNIDSGTETEYTFTSGAYGHANGMTYNPYTDRLYVAAMKGTGEVYVLDRSLTLVDTLYAKDGNGTAFSCWNIAYDRRARRFITVRDDAIHFFDDSFSHVRSIPFDISAWAGTRQDIETDGRYIYAVSFNTNNIYVFSMSGPLVKTISNTGFAGEPESLMYDWINDRFYMEGMNNGWVIRLTEFIEAE